MWWTAVSCARSRAHKREVRLTDIAHYRNVSARTAGIIIGVRTRQRWWCSIVPRSGRHGSYNRKRGYKNTRESFLHAADYLSKF